MKRSFVQKITNSGNFPVVEKEMRAEENIREIKAYVQNAHEIIARGNGRCYGDAALGERIFSTKRLNKFISFDRLNGILECESGVLLSDILEVIVPQGYFLSVTPCTKFITLGGAIASDVHGKNHHSEGCFSEHVIEFSLLIENGDILTCSRDSHPGKFWATIGGMGLTGIILSAKIKLKNIETAYIRQEQIKAENLDEIFRLFEESESWTYNVAWIDCLQKGKNLGKSILIRGEHAFRHELPAKKSVDPLRFKKKNPPSVPFFFPEFFLNTITVRFLNWLYYALQTKKKTGEIVDYDRFFYPLDVVANWNNMYCKI